MALTKEKKKEVVQKLDTIFKESASVVFVNFHGLSVEEETNMRGTLRDNGVGYTVAKKTLTKRALEGAQLAGDVPALDGELALAYGEDPTAPAREIYAFQKSTDGAVSILGGVFVGGLRDKEMMLEIAQIPSLQTLRGMFVNLINSPIQRVVVALGQIAEKRSA